MRGHRRVVTGPVLVDVRGLQDSPGDSALDLLRTARTCLPGRRLIGLVDPDRPALLPAARDCLDTVCRSPHQARRSRPDCFVRLAPCEDDALFTAPLLLDPAIPSVALDRPPASAVARYWRSRADVVAPADTLWQSASALRRGADAERLAVITATPDLPLCRALRRLGAHLYGPEIVAALSPHYGQTLFVLANSAASARLIPLLRRYGGSAALLDSCLLDAYGDAQAAALASGELARSVPDAELRQWRDGIARPTALLLGEVAAVADRLFVHSAWLADEIARRYGRTAELLPPVHDLPRIRAQTAAGQGESCIWAIEMLRVWGHEVRLDLLCPAEEHDALTALAGRLGVGDLVGFAPHGFTSGPASVSLVLAMRGQASMAAALAAAGSRCIASRGVVEGADGADVLTVPDQPSPPLLAETILAALPADRAPDAARRLAAALGL